VPAHFRNERFNYLDDLLVISPSLESDFEVVYIFKCSKLLTRFHFTLQITCITLRNFQYFLIFLEPITSILGGPEIYIDLGSTVNLTCVIKHLPDPPISVQWNHNNQVKPKG